MRRAGPAVLALTLLAAAAALAGCSPRTSAAPEAPEIEAGQQIGDATLTTLEGGSVQFKELTQGKVALVDVWATWCAPCIAAMPHLQALHNRFKDDGFTVVGVMIDRNATAIGPEFMQKKRVTYPTVMDDDGARIEGVIGPVSGIPTLLLIDREGRLVRKFMGAAPPDVLEKAVADVLRGVSAPAAAAAPTV